MSIKQEFLGFLAFFSGYAISLGLTNALFAYAIIELSGSVNAACAFTVVWLMSYFFIYVKILSKIRYLRCLNIQPKQEEVSLGGIMIPKPVSEPLAIGQGYYPALIDAKGESLTWIGNGADFRLLELNLIHLTEENQQKHVDALIKLHAFE